MILLPFLLHLLGVSSKYVVIVAVVGLIGMKKLKARKQGGGMTSHGVSRQGRKDHDGGYRNGSYRGPWS